VKVEDGTGGARVDLGFTLLRKRFAVEVEISEDLVVENIRNDLETGFGGVVTLLDEGISTEVVEGAVIAESDAMPPEVQIDYLPHQEAALDPFLNPSLPPLRRPSQQRPGGPFRALPRTVSGE